MCGSFIFLFNFEILGFVFSLLKYTLNSKMLIAIHTTDIMNLKASLDLNILRQGAINRKPLWIGALTKAW